MPFRIIRNDITKVKADAIVNTANPEARFAGGTDAAVYAAAGAQALLAERKKIGRIAPGQAAVTSALRLPAKYIIHTVGPAWIDGMHGEYDILRSCYRKSLFLADQLKCESIAFPLIATGVYGFPKDRALEIALTVIREYLEKSDLQVTLVVFGRDSFQIASGLAGRVEEYIDENYVSEKFKEEYGSPMEGASDARAGRSAPERERYPSNARWNVFPSEAGAPHFAPEPAAFASPAKKKTSLEDVMSHLGESFQARLLRMIDERGMSDPEVYKRANVDRKLFSKIRCSENYIPKKRTICALAIALRLSLDDTKDLMSSAGLALTNNNKTDVIVSFCIENGIYNIYEVNALLFQFDQPVLG